MTTALSITTFAVTMTEVRLEVMNWAFMIINILSLFSNLGIEIYRRWKNRDDKNVKPIEPDDIIGGDDNDKT